MSIVVEHDKRRKQILKKALDVFMEEGFEDTTYQKIADRCKITRTTLYLYFRNRQEIFNFSIKQFMAEVEQDILGVKDNKTLSCSSKLKKIMFLILTRLEENRLLISVILNYLLSKSTEAGKLKSDIPLEGKSAYGNTGTPSLSYNLVRRRTIRHRRILSAMLFEGIKTGQLRKIDVGAANDLLFSIIESAIFRLAVLKRESTTDLKAAAELAINELCS